MNIYLAGAIVAVALWGGSGVYRGAKWTIKNAGCIARHGVKYCKAKPPAAPPASQN